MSGIFGGHLFDGMGQASSDTSFDSLISQLRTTGGSTTTTSATTSDKSATAPLPGGVKDSGGASWAPQPTPAPSTPATAYVPTSTDHTMLYVVGGVAAVGILAATLFVSRPRSVSANKRRVRRNSGSDKLLRLAQAGKWFEPVGSYMRFATRELAEQQADAYRKVYKTAYKVKVEPVPSKSRPGATSYQIYFKATPKYLKIIREW